MLGFIIGLFAGVLLGICVMALLKSAAYADSDTDALMNIDKENDDSQK